MGEVNEGKSDLPGIRLVRLQAQDVESEKNFEYLISTSSTMQTTQQITDAFIAPRRAHLAHRMACPVFCGISARQQCRALVQRTIDAHSRDELLSRRNLGLATLPCMWLMSNTVAQVRLASV